MDETLTQPDDLGDLRPDPPAPARWGVGRVLRVATGVREDVLAHVPSERARYTSMGGVVLGTAIMAMLSMGVALYEIFGHFQWFILAAVPVWGMFIISLDRWLMSSTISGHASVVLRRLLPRLGLSIALGIVLAEPLLLGIYNTAILERVNQDRQAVLTTTGSKLRTCNPVPGTPEANAPASHAPECQKQYRLSVSGDSPDALQSQLDTLTQQETALKSIVDTDTTNYANLENQARLECNGTPGAGLTGRYGDGVNCERLRKEADQYHTDHKMDENGQKLAQLDGQIIDLKNRLGTAKNDYATNVNNAIQQKVQAVKDGQKDIGLLERFRTLDELVSENGYVRLTQWAIRIFFIIVDALPIILKALSGTTPYDRILKKRLAGQAKTEQLRADREMYRHTKYGDLVQHRRDLQYRVEVERLDETHRIELGNYEERRGELIDALEDHLMRTASGAAVAGWQPPHVVDVDEFADVPTQELTPLDMREGRR